METKKCQMPLCLGPSVLKRASSFQEAIVTSLLQHTLIRSVFLHCLSHQQPFLYSLFNASLLHLCCAFLSEAETATTQVHHMCINIQLARRTDLKQENFKAASIG